MGTSILDGGATGRQLRLRRLRVRVVQGPDAGLDRTFDTDPVRIGTSAGSDLLLSDSAVSGRHAELRRTPDGALLRDVGSTNGTRMGPLKVREVLLQHRCRFGVGRSELEFLPADELVDIVAGDRTELCGLVGQSTSMRELFGVIERIGPTDLPVLVHGETGTGKELVCRAIHACAPQRDGLVVLDAASVAGDLVEAELFGAERGAFTGAEAARAGLFEQADGGTLFLDEIGELDLALQPSLLRVLEQREVRRLGGTRLRPVDVRVVAATHRDLEAAVQAGAFREDLYYRLAVLELHVPPLRERLEDLDLLVAQLLASAPGPPRIRGISDEVREVFRAWRWPGNVRELRNVLLRAVPFSDGEVVELDALPPALSSGAPDPGPDALLRSSELPFYEAKERLLDIFEVGYVRDLLRRSEGNVARAARLAQVDRKTIFRMLKRHGLR